MALCGQDAVNPTDALPPVLARDIFSRLPADARARAACVCPAWRTAIADPALWRRLDLSAESGVTCRVDDAALRAAAARARGGLEALGVTGKQFSWQAVLAVAAANAASLRELQTAQRQYGPDEWTTEPQLQALLAAAPTLQVLEADVCCGGATARRLLRNEPPLGPLRLRGLFIEFDDEDEEEQERTFPALAELLAHPIARLGLYKYVTAPLTPDELGLVADAAQALLLSELIFDDCVLSPAAAPALVRMLSSAALTEFTITNLVHGPAVPVFDVPAAALLSDALRANRTLRRFTLLNVELWNDVQAAVTLWGVLTGHASIRTLVLNNNRVPTVAAAVAIGVALGALVAANAPALEELEVCGCSLGDVGLGPLCDALPRNNHLRELKVVDIDMSAAFAARRLLPAVRANTSLRDLDLYHAGEVPEAAMEAMLLVEAREQARVAALGARPSA
jgi:hypothetical protein